ncbi:CLUMA_CG009407, isoform C [Clunio marinus]|uniref:CLUMA_CG009407, isoform C n=1 Tax=Clunio marinus TaxID=568069 RepID=A0A1J1I6P7_9DIPT|nr:CLUMA_CG009407, isoform C [Clunio marinus]
MTNLSMKTCTESKQQHHKKKNKIEILNLRNNISTITPENTLAYKSLVEDPKELLFMAPLEEKCGERDENEVNGTSTLPRSISSDQTTHQQSNKAATLSKLLRKNKGGDSEPSTSSPLKILRDKSFPIGKPRLKILPSVGSESVNSTTFLLDHDCENPCETPSYMANAAGNFNLNIETSETPKAEIKPIEDNPLPLPPRDRKLQLNVAQKRHVRKYPLIIPASGIQRTLDKINQITPNNFPASVNATRHSLVNLNNGHRTYENLEAFQKRFSCHDEADTASLHFESILENDENVPNITDDMVDGFCVFESGSKQSFDGVVKKPSDRKCVSKVAPSPAIESKKLEFSQKYPKYKMPRNELASNALFNKIKESVENAAMAEECEVELDVGHECELKKSINHVSCEDLLDFSEMKPKGRERGAESDEVRIMIKMFGMKITLERCLLTLDFINWDLQKAIKLCKLQNLKSNFSLQECLEQLEPHWDLNQIAKKN